ncbi:MAG: hypothetical protein JW838_03720 [Spirochaetes bacterium]|nr:hypothetical protein [Spirochaetota bacterium]
MHTRKGLLHLLLSAMVLAFSGCWLDGDNPSLVEDEGNLSTLVISSLKSNPEKLENYLASHGLAYLDKVTVNGDTGYLYEFTGKVDKNGVTKKCLILTGKAHSMGYQAAYLRPGSAHLNDTIQGTYEMLSVYIKKVGLDQFGTFGLNIPYGTPKGDAVWNEMFALFDTLGQIAITHIPHYMLDEMDGIVDGLHAYAANNLVKGSEEYNAFMKISRKEVVALNQGVDSSYFMIAALLHKVPENLDGNPYGNTTAHMLAVNLFIKAISISMGISPAEAARVLPTLKVDQTKIFDLFRAGCNEYAVSGKATLNGETYHGRDFMFSTADIYQDASCVMVYIPDDTDGDPATVDLPFITSDAPGFVGHASGINNHGLSVGVDVSQSAGFGIDPGIGCLLVNRDMLQKASNIDEAIRVAKRNDRGVPWIYIVADDDSMDTYGNSVILECVRSDVMDNGRKYRGYKQLDPWRRLRFALAISLLPSSDIPDNGVLVRSAKWRYPRTLEYLPTIDPNSWPAHPKFGLDLTPYFPRQTEKWDDVVIGTNHFIAPEMRFGQLYMPVQFLYGMGPLRESMWRYDFAYKIIKENYGRIVYWTDLNEDDRPDYGCAGWLIDYLNPAWENRDGVRANSWFYTSENPTYDDLLNEQVHGHHIAFNNTTGEMKALYGYMLDPWVGLNIKDMIDTIK